MNGIGPPPGPAGRSSSRAALPLATAPSAALARTLSGAEPRHLATLVAVADTHSFKAAGESLGYGQSAVSQQIAQLERLLGTTVVTRTPGQAAVVLTEVGAIVARHAKEILGQLDAASSDLRAEQHADPRLRVGVHDRVLMPAITRAIGLLSTSEPALRLLVRDGQAPPEHRGAALRRGTLDAAFDDLPLGNGPFDHVEVLRDPIVLVVHGDSDLAARGELSSLEELADVPLLADRDSPVLALLESQLDAAGLQPHVVLWSRLTSSLQALVAGGLGAALLPRLAVDARDPATTTVELGGLLPPRRIGLYWHRQRRRVPGLEAFRDTLIEALNEPLCPTTSRT
jgi:DNA-binding transcriptional LysR family regulator